ncbi:MAG: ATP-binding protein [Niastella sp.]|nr:ATP-binding protein [Niastella sp.]
MLRYFCILILLLTCSIAIAQDRFTSEPEAEKALSSLSGLAASPKKTALLLKLSDWYLLKGNRTPAELEQSFRLADEAMSLSARLKDLRGQASSYLQLSKTEEARHQLEQGEQFAQKAVVLYAQLHLPDELGESYVSLWSIGTGKGIGYAERISILKQADSAFKKSDNKRRQADCLIQMGELSHLTGDWAVALSYLEECLQLYKATSYIHLQAVYDLLGTVNFTKGDYKSSIEYELLAIKSAEATKDSSMMLCAIYNHIGQAYRHIKDLPKAKYYYERSMAVARRHNDVTNIAVVAINYSDLLLKAEDGQAALAFMSSLRKDYPALDTLFGPYIASVMIDIYARLNMPEKAATFCRIAEKELAHPIDDLDLEAQLEQSLTLFYLKFRDYSKAAYYLARYDSFGIKTKSKLHTSNIFLLKFRMDTATKHYVSAISHLQRYIELRDSLFAERKIKEINQLSILYETEKKDKNILALEHQTDLQVSVIKQEKTVRNFSLAAAGLLILVAFLFYKAYQSKQQINKVLQAHQQEIHEKNASLQRLVTEKEWLVKEIHHRVKNNLHMVVGLLASQAEFIKGREALDAINESQHRIQAMSLIHQKLYQADNLSSIDMPSYIHELVEYLKTTFDRQTPIRFILDIARVSFPLSHSIPIGLILNEAVTNAIKYAFPGGREGAITIRLTQTHDNHFTLSIHDNGIGLPPGFNAQSNNTLGTTLMEGLSGDIGARFSMKSEQGTHIDIDFILKPQAHPGETPLSA